MSRKKKTAPTAADYSRDAAGYKHRRSRKAPIIITIVIVLILAAAGGAWAAWNNLQSSIALDDDTITEDTFTEVEVSEPYWTLILGSDSRSEKGDRARSDVLMLVRVDQANKQLTLISFPRDTKVDIEGYGTQKINAAYSLGGADLAVKTVEDYAGVKISHYAEVYFKGFKKVVNALGGITVNVPEYCSYHGVTLYPGKQKLNGKQALTFARCRKTYAMGDFTRTQCQRILVSAIARKICSESITEIPATVTAVADCFSTDMTLTELIDLATSMQGLKSSNIYSAMAPSTTGMVNGVSYTFTYINQWKLLMQKAKNGEDPELTDEEEDIVGYASTKDNTLDMDEGLASYVQDELDEYYEEQEAKAAKKAKSELADQTSSSGSSSKSSSKK